MGVSRKVVEKEEEGTERKRIRKDGKENMTRTGKKSNEHDEGGRETGTMETPEETEIAEGTETGSSSSRQQTEGEGASEG